MKNANWKVIILVTIILAPIFLFLQQPTAQASTSDNWPMFQHDSAHTGYSRSVFPTTNLTVAWTFQPIPYEFAFRTPTITDDNLYITDQNQIYCINASSGKLTWNQSLTRPIPLAWWGFSTAVSGGCVYTDSAAYNASTGQLMFNYAEQGCTSPTIANGLIYIGSNLGGVVALSAATGVKMWNYTAGKVEFSPAVAGGVVYFSSSDRNVYALDASTGRELWRVPSIGDRYTHTVVADGYVYLNGHGGIFYCLNALTGAKVWNQQGNSGLSGPQNSPAVANGYVYAGSDAFNATTGVPLWHNNILSGSSPAIAEGVVYVDYYNEPSDSFKESIHALNASTGTEIWNYDFPGEYDTYLVSNPLIADDMLYIGTGAALYAFSASSLSPTATSQTNIPSNLTPFFSNYLFLVIIILVPVILAIVYLVIKRRKSKT